MSHTYPIAIRTDGVRHEQVEGRFAQDLIELSSRNGVEFYHGGLRKYVKVHFELLASLQDQPERRSVNYIMLGNSQYTASWRLMLDIAAVAKKIPACEGCFLNKLLLGEVSNTTCVNCAN